MIRCILCDTQIQYRIVTPCNHNELCLECYLRSIVCYDNHCCSCCTNEFASPPIATTNLDPNLKYNSFNLQHMRIFKKYFLYYNENCIATEISKYMTYACPKCDSKFDSRSSHTPANSFYTHMRNVHNLCCCQICLNSNRFLPCEAVCYSQKEFEDHKKNLHPKCPCCPFFAFDAHTLELHMNERHVRCAICLNKFNKILWLKDERALLEHYSHSHFVCYHPECEEALIAFPSRLELVQHLNKVHHEQIDMTGMSLVPDNEAIEEMIAAEENEKQNRVVSSNRKFIQKLNQVFSHDQGKIKLLKNQAGLLIKNKISVEKFYQNFCEICGENKNRLFTDMVAIMPDPEKRAELLRMSENVEIKPKIHFRTQSPPSGHQKPHQNFPKSSSMPNVTNDINDESDEVDSPITGTQQEPAQQLPQQQQQQPKQSKKKKAKKTIISVC